MQLCGNQGGRKPLTPFFKYIWICMRVLIQFWVNVAFSHPSIPLLASSQASYSKSYHPVASSCSTCKKNLKYFGGTLGNLITLSHPSSNYFLEMSDCANEVEPSK